MNIKENIDFEFFLEPPDMSTTLILSIEALTPLSMVVSQPGSYYRCQDVPTKEMLLGMFENALGWHIETICSHTLQDNRKKIIKNLKKLAYKRYKQEKDKNPSWQSWLEEEATSSGSDFISLLQYHISVETAFIPQSVHFDDLWSLHLRRGDDGYLGGSRNYDFKAEPIIDKARGKNATIKVNNKGIETASIKEIQNMESGSVHYKVLRPFFPQYYISPTPREYIIPQANFQFRLNTTEKLAKLLIGAINNPQAPLYLGTNDGWVECSLEVISWN